VANKNPQVADPSKVMICELGLSTLTASALGNASYKVGLHRTVWPRTVAELFAHFTVGSLLATPKLGEGAFIEIVGALVERNLLIEGCDPSIMMYKAHSRWKIPEAAAESVRISSRKAELRLA